MSQVRVERIVSLNDSAAPDFPTGFTVTGQTLDEKYPKNIFVKGVVDSSGIPEDSSSGLYWWNADHDSGKGLLAVNVKGSWIGVTKYVEPPVPTPGWLGNRAHLAGGAFPNDSTIQYYDITTPGNSTDFGDLTSNFWGKGTASSGTTIVSAGGNRYDGSYTTGNQIDTWTSATPGNATDFGDLSQGRQDVAATGDGTYGIWGGGRTGNSSTTYVNTIDYVTIASAGNAADWGDLTISRWGLSAGGDATRGLYIGGKYPYDYGGSSPDPQQSNVVDYITYATAGNAVDFGDMLEAHELAQNGMVTSATRSLRGGGENTSTSSIEYYTTATTGNGTDFGDLTANRYHLAGASNGTYGTFAAGTTGSYSNVIEYVTIATTGNAIDFGDTYAAKYALSGAAGNAS